MAARGRGLDHEPGKQFFAYCQESVIETKKVVWPTRKETMQTTGTCSLFVFVMAFFCG